MKDECFQHLPVVIELGRKLLLASTKCLFNGDLAGSKSIQHKTLNLLKCMLQKEILVQWLVCAPAFA